MWHMYSEITGFWNHQSVTRHPNWLYLYAGIVDAGAQKNVLDLFLSWKGHLATYTVSLQASVDYYG